MLLMIAAPLMPRRTPGDPQRMPILLVHGWNCNAGIWWPLRRHLRSRRVGDVHAIDLPFWQPIDRQLDHLARSVETILAASPHDRLAIVGHSMGGVIARLFLETERGRTCTGRLISIASPHHGTVLARRALDPAGRDLSPDNAQLAEPAAVAAGVAVTTFYSDIDNFVSPQSSAKLAGAENLRCSEIGHMQLLFTSAVLEAVAFRLEHTR
jgi:pimeloyl-ACP methyl ester carboxylesterase